MHSFKALFLVAAGLWAAQVNVSVTDGTASHTHSPGSPFLVTLRADRAGVTAKWVNAEGTAYTEPVTLPVNTNYPLYSPSNAGSYCGLILTPASSDSLPTLPVGVSREFGFLLLNDISEQRTLDTTSDMGLWNYPVTDAFLNPGWSHSLSTDAFDTLHWQENLLLRRNSGLMEVPSIGATLWNFTDDSAATDTRLNLLQNNMSGYFRADAQHRFWQFPLDTLRTGPFYWSNLELKIQAVRDASAAAASSVNLIYSCNGFAYDDIETFMQGPLAPQVDIFGLSLLRSPNFEDPSGWMSVCMDSIRQSMLSAGRSMPLWVTELGVTANEDGYIGLTRPQSAPYLIKAHVLALAHGAQKVFWNGFQDKGLGTTEYRDHLGLVDYSGFPRSTFTAYRTLGEALRGKWFNILYSDASGIQAADFTGPDENVTVVWSANGSTAATFTALGIDPAAINRVTDLAGTDIPVSGSDISLTEQPFFVHYFTPIQIEQRKMAVPAQRLQLASFPNPFTSSAFIRYQLPRAAQVVLDLYSVDGRKIRNLEKGNQAAGVHQILFNGRDKTGRRLAAGFYLLRLTAGGQTFVKKIIAR